MTDLSHIRNFSIIAHIDHGKSTLADRMIQLCGGLTDREMHEQVLDNMELERERGITIKAQTVRLEYKARDGETYHLNLMDTPGHVDFSYEVSRSLAACEGALLVVDASQGVEAQTLANAYLAIDADLELVPVLNKVDLPAAEPDRIRQQIEDVIGLDASEAVMISAKTGLGVDEVLESIVTKMPPPEGDADSDLQALLVDSWYDPYLGVVALMRVKHGTLKKGQKIRMMSTGIAYTIDRVGVFTPARTETGALGPGEIGFITASIKTVADFKGLKLRSPEGMAAEVFRRIGAAPTSIPFPELYTALDKKVVDAADASSYTNNHALGFNKIAQYPIYPGIHSMAVLQFVINQAVWDKIGPNGQAALETWYYAAWTDMTRATELQDRKLVALDKAGKGTPGVKIIDWAQEERDKLRNVAQGAWSDISKQSPLAKQAYDAHIKFMKTMGLLN